MEEMRSVQILRKSKPFLGGGGGLGFERQRFLEIANK